MTTTATTSGRSAVYTGSNLAFKSCGIYVALSLKRLYGNFRRLVALFVVEMHCV